MLPSPPAPTRRDDPTSPRLLLAATLAALAAAPVLVAVVRPGPLALPYGVVLGGAASAIRAVEATVLPRWFGIAHIGEIRGVVMAASALGPLALAVVADRFGTYAPALVAFTGGTAVLGVLGAVVRPPDAAPTSRPHQKLLDGHAPGLRRR